MNINIYWNDLSKEGQETLINSGFETTAEQLREEQPIGVIKTH